MSRDSTLLPQVSQVLLQQLLLVVGVVQTQRLATGNGQRGAFVLRVDVVADQLPGKAARIGRWPTLRETVMRPASRRRGSRTWRWQSVVML